jgi:hypothetical protein
MPGRKMNPLKFLESGTSLVEALVSIGISSTVLLATSSLFSSTVKTNHDQSIRTETLVHAQAALQMIGNELKPLGNGVPFDQANFEIGENTLSDPLITYPIVTDSTDASQITFRLNETGEISLLTQAFNPAATTTIHLSDVSAYQANDPIYISNGVVSGDDGLYGKIQSVNSSSKTIVLDGSSLVYSPAATFNMGSILEEVPVITFKNLSGGAGIVRDSGFGEVLIAEDAVVSFEYLDASGNSVALPLTATSIVNDLRAVRLSVRKNHPNKLSTGQTYFVNASQTFALRNLNILY